MTAAEDLADLPRLNFRLSEMQGGDTGTLQLFNGITAQYDKRVIDHAESLQLLHYVSYQDPTMA